MGNLQKRVVIIFFRENTAEKASEAPIDIHWCTYPIKATKLKTIIYKQKTLEIKKKNPPNKAIWGKNINRTTTELILCWPSTAGSGTDPSFIYLVRLQWRKLSLSLQAKSIGDRSLIRRRAHVHFLCQCWDPIWFGLVQPLCMLPQSIFICAWVCLCLKDTLWLLYSFPFSFYSWIPKGGFDEDIPLRAGFSKGSHSAHRPLWGSVNFYLIQEEVSMTMADQDMDWPTSIAECHLINHEASISQSPHNASHQPPAM